MSRVKKELALFPPTCLQEGKRPEVLVSTGHACSYCHGNGWYWGFDGREAVRRDCPVCEGSGELDALITIQWFKKGGKEGYER